MTTTDATQAGLRPLPLDTLDGVCVLTLEQPKPVVVLNLELIRRLDLTLAQVPANAKGLVVRSEGKVFVAGADLNEIQQTSDPDLHAYLELGAKVFGRLAQFPFTTVAAIHGAALGGGLELAMHCDLLVAAPGAKPYPIGLPEAGLAICPGWGGTNMLPARIDPVEAIKQTCVGKPMVFDEARAAGLFDHVSDSAETLLQDAARLAAETPVPARDGDPSRWIGRDGPAVHAALDGARSELPETQATTAVTAAVETGLANGWSHALQKERDELVRLRHTPEATAALEAFFAKSKK